MKNINWLQKKTNVHPFDSDNNINLVGTPKTFWEVKIRNLRNSLLPAKKIMEKYKEKLEKIYQELNQEEDPIQKNGINHSSLRRYYYSL